MMAFAKMAVHGSNRSSLLQHRNSPTVVAIGTQAAGTGAVNPGLPTGWAQGDLLLIFVESATATAFVPSGYAEFFAVQNADNTSTLHLYWKIAGSSETAPTVADHGDHTIARIIAIRGVGTDGLDSVSWLDSTGSNMFGTIRTGNSGTPSFGASATYSNNTLQLAILWAGTDTVSAQVSGGGWSSLTERMDDWTTSGDGGGFAVATAPVYAADAVAGFSATKATSDQWGTIMIYVRGKLE